MEGNYRIVQLSENEFVIEKEIVEVIKYPWYRFKNPTIKSTWHKVDQKGNFVIHYALINQTLLHYKASDLKTCQDRLEQIKKYPLIIE